MKKNYKCYWGHISAVFCIISSMLYSAEVPFNDWTLITEDSTVTETGMLNYYENTFSNRDYKYFYIPKKFIGAKITKGKIDCKENNIFTITNLPLKGSFYIVPDKPYLPTAEAEKLTVEAIKKDGTRQVLPFSKLLYQNEKIGYVLKGRNGYANVLCTLYHLDFENIDKIVVNAGKNVGNIFITEGKSEIPSFPPRILMKDTNKNISAIIIPENASGVAEFASKELQSYIEKVTNKRIPIISESKHTGTEPAIYIGANSILEKYGLNKNKLKKLIPEEGFIIKSIPEGLIIVGHDSVLWKAELFEKKLHDAAEIIDVERIAGPYYGTLYGVYSFLEDFAGVGWFFPGPLGEVVPENRNIEIPAIDRIERPDFSMRNVSDLSLTSIREIKLPEYSGNFYEEVRRNYPLHMRFQFNMKYFFCHSMVFWGELFGKEHPEYFALVKGKRSNDWDNSPGTEKGIPGGVHRSFCWANPAMIKRQIDETRLFFSSEKEWFGRFPWRRTPRIAYPVIMNDGIQDFCECEYCRKYFSPETPYRASLSDLYAYHLNEIAKNIKKEFPEKYVAGIAYGATVLPPEKIKVENNVVYGLASTAQFLFALYNTGTKKWNEEWINSWTQKAKIAGLWLYIERLRSNYNHLPMVLAHAMADEIKSRKGKIDGYFLQLGKTDMFSALEIYLYSRLLWNAKRSTETEIDRFMVSLFGPAAKPVKNVYSHLEELWQNEMKDFQPGPDKTGLPIPDWKMYPVKRLYKNVFTPEKIKPAIDFLEEAIAMLPVRERDIVLCTEQFKRHERVKRLRD